MALTRQADRETQEELRQLAFRRRQISIAIEALERLQSLQHKAVIARVGAAELADSELGGSMPRATITHRCGSRRR